MLETIEATAGIYLQDLEPGAVIDAETRGHRYRIEYLGGDEIRISGHPSLCPVPIQARLKGSLDPSGELQNGYVGRGMRLLFRRQEDYLGVVTSAITHVSEVRSEQVQR